MKNILNKVWYSSTPPLWALFISVLILGFFSTIFISFMVEVDGTIVIGHSITLECMVYIGTALFLLFFIRSCIDLIFFFINFKKSLKKKKLSLYHKALYTHEVTHVYKAHTIYSDVDRLYTYDQRMYIRNMVVSNNTITFITPLENHRLIVGRIFDLLTVILNDEKAFTITTTIVGSEVMYEVLSYYNLFIENLEDNVITLVVREEE
jgi:hypothetical protein